MKIGDMTIVVRIKVEISFWDALKLRLAGARRESIEDIFKSKDSEEAIKKRIIEDTL